MNDEVGETIEQTGVSRRGLLVRGGAAAAGLTALGGPAAVAFGAGAGGGAIKVAVVTHGDTGSFWSVFKKGVDQGGEGPQRTRRQRHAGVREQRRRQAGVGPQRGDRRQARRSSRHRCLMPAP